MEIWKAEKFEIATYYGVGKVEGYTYRGLGLHMMMAGSPKGRRPPLWRLTHLGTGHGLVTLNGHVAVAFPVATQIAEAGEWDFLSPEGWRDLFPDAKERLAEILDAYPKVASRVKGSGMNREVAMQIASNRP